MRRRGEAGGEERLITRGRGRGRGRGGGGAVGMSGEAEGGREKESGEKVNADTYARVRREGQAGRMGASVLPGGY